MKWIVRSVAVAIAMSLAFVASGGTTFAKLSPKGNPVLEQAGVESPNSRPLAVQGGSVDVDGLKVRVVGAGNAKKEGARHRWQEKDLAHIAQRTDDGAQLLSVLESSSSPNAISYDFPGRELQLLPDGAVAVVDPTGDGELVAYIDPPWAKDASGAAVQTHYEVAGSKLIQHVVATDETEYPVVADPSITNKWYGQQIRFSKTETRRIGVGAGACGIVALGIPDATISKIVAAACGSLALAAGAALGEGNCLAVNVWSTGQKFPWYWDC